MAFRCEECNHENLPQHRFCGMCGAKLPSRRRAARNEQREREEAQAFSRPTLLGLADEDPPDAEGAAYLLEKDPGEHRVRWLMLLVLVAGIAAAGWHWRSEMGAWMAKAGRNPNLTAEANPSVNTPEVPSAPTPSTNPPDTNAAENSAQTAAPVPAATEPASPSPPASEAAKQQGEPVEDRSAETTKAALKQAATKVEYKTANKNASADALEAQGEDYLYGRGMPADCNLAGKNLLTAAHSSVKAQSVLGTMYATGHCVTRDLPAAYRWYTKASHQEPGNARLRRDMEVLWQQMTPEEQEVAMKKEP